jgi:hypothetical protein
MRLFLGKATTEVGEEISGCGWRFTQILFRLFDIRRRPLQCQDGYLSPLLTEQ